MSKLCFVSRKSSSKMVSKFEDLPNEVLLLILGNLSGVDLLRIFVGLNDRFDVLMKKYFFEISLDFRDEILCRKDAIDLVSRCRSFRVVSILLSEKNMTKISDLFCGKMFSSLENLSLIEVDRRSSERILSSLVDLKSFSLISSSWRNFTRCSLRKFVSLKCCRVPRIDFLSASNSEIRRLTLDFCSSDDLSKICEICPRLSSLVIRSMENVRRDENLFFPRTLKFLEVSFRSSSLLSILLLLKNVEKLKKFSFDSTRTEIDEFFSLETFLFVRRRVEKVSFRIESENFPGNRSIDEIRRNFPFDEKIFFRRDEKNSFLQIFTAPVDQKNFRLFFASNRDEIFPPEIFRRVEKIFLRQNFLNETFFSLNLRKIVFFAQNLPPNFNELHRISTLRTLELFLTTKNPESKEILRNFLQNSTKIKIFVFNNFTVEFLLELFDENSLRFPKLDAIRCSIKDRHVFDNFILIFIEFLQQKSLISLHVNVENNPEQTNLLAGWLLKTDALRRAKFTTSQHHCAVWI